MIQYLPDDKTYLADILLGTTTDTDDLEGKVIDKVESFDWVNEELVKRKVHNFQGKQIQIPPIYSAIKQGGMKMYELARSGRAPKEIKGREIEVYSIEVVSIELPTVKLRIACSKGTYIRSIARDLGNQLKTGGCLSSLVREQSGTHNVSESVSVETLSQENGLEKALISPVFALGLQSVVVCKQLAKKISQGQSVSIDELKMSSSSPVPEEVLSKRFFVCLDKTPIALMKAFQSELANPEVVLTNADNL